MLKEVRCPICHRVTPWEGNPHRPFCSERCRVRDVGNWASERYRIPSQPAEPPADETTENDDSDA
jgi:endogenous inhibitor of DNA gyrase (YacG/DUF329 family)